MLLVAADRFGWTLPARHRLSRVDDTHPDRGGGDVERRRADSDTRAALRWLRLRPRRHDYLGSELLPGAARLVRALRALDRKVVFVSNNPTRDPEEYARKLSEMGLPAHGSLTAASARGRIGSVQLLGASRPRIFPGLRFALGSTPLNRARSIAKAGAEMSSSSQRACSVPTAWWCDKVAPQSTNCC